MGFAPDLQKGASNIVSHPKGKEWYEGFSKGGEAAGKAAFDLIGHFAQMKFPEKLAKQYSPGSPVYSGVWEYIIKTADSFNDPGRFTALIGYEWTSVPKGFNMHRNVIMRDDGRQLNLPMALLTRWTSISGWRTMRQKPVARHLQLLITATSQTAGCSRPSRPIPAARSTRTM
jgi:hypothetical protein